MLPGDSLFGKIGGAIEDSDCVLAFLSSKSVRSKWVQRELNAFLAKEAKGSRPMVVPILLGRVSPPAFLSDRLQVRVSSLTRSEATQQILKGVFRRQSVILVAPNAAKVYELNDLGEHIALYHSEARAGQLLMVYECSQLIDSALSALLPEPNGFGDSDDADKQWRLAWPRCIDALIALTPRIIATIAAYSGDDVAWSHNVNRLLCLVWRLVILSLFFRLYDRSKWRIKTEAADNFAEVYSEWTRVGAKSESLVGRRGVGPLVKLWLYHLDLNWDECFDIGFRGTQTIDGMQIFNAGHVLIPRGTVRWDSLTVFQDTSPDAEFTNYNWLKYILPYIVADKVLEIGFSSRELSEVIPRVGVRKDDFYYFGLE